MKTTLLIFALSLCSVCANPEGNKFRYSLDAWGSTYQNACHPLDIGCNRRNLPILSIVADNARAYLATPEAFVSFNGRLAEAVIRQYNVEKVIYAEAHLDTNDIEMLSDVYQEVVDLLQFEQDEAFKARIK